MKQEKKDENIPHSNYYYHPPMSSSLLRKWSRTSPKPINSPIVRDQIVQLDPQTTIRINRKRDSNVSTTSILDRDHSQVTPDPSPSPFPFPRFRGIFHISVPEDLEDYDFYYDMRTQHMVYKDKDLIII